MILSREEVIAAGERVIARASDPQERIALAPDLERAPEPEAPEIIAFRQVLATGHDFAVGGVARGNAVCPMRQTVFGFPSEVNDENVNDNALVIRLAFAWDDAFSQSGVVHVVCSAD